MTEETIAYLMAHLDKVVYQHLDVLVDGVLNHHLAMIEKRLLEYVDKEKQQ